MAVLNDLVTERLWCADDIRYTETDMHVTEMIYGRLSFLQRQMINSSDVF